MENKKFAINRISNKKFRKIHYFRNIKYKRNIFVKRKIFAKKNSIIKIFTKKKFVEKIFPRKVFRKKKFEKNLKNNFRDCFYGFLVVERFPKGTIKV